MVYRPVFDFGFVKEGTDEYTSCTVSVYHYELISGCSNLAFPVLLEIEFSTEFVWETGPH